MAHYYRYVSGEMNGEESNRGSKREEAGEVRFVRRTGRLARDAFVSDECVLSRRKY